jgi:hypothetical protein
MNHRTRAKIWLALSLTCLTAMLLSRSYHGAWLEPLGILFLAAPIAATLLTVRIDFKKDSVTATCVISLVVLFGLTWLL